MKDQAENMVSDQEMGHVQMKYPNNTPQTKEALMYRNIFESMYGGRDHLIDQYWMPKWVSSSVTDPSATYLAAHGFRNKSQ